MKQHILLNPGPACTTTTVKNAMLSIGDVCPREDETGTLMNSISMRTKNLLTSESERFECVLFTSSGTGAVESVISSLPFGATVLNIVNGSYGKRIGLMLKVYNIPHHTLTFDGKINLDEVEEHLKSGYSHVSMVHCETTSGIINDISAMGTLTSQYGQRLIVDAMSSAFAYNIDCNRDNIDFLVCSSNKLVQGMPGIGMVVAYDEAIQECFARTVYFNLKAQSDAFKNSNQMRFTPATNILGALEQALVELEEETIRERFLRYERLNKKIRKQMQLLGFEPLVDEENNSIVITSFIEPDGFNFESFHEYLKEKGFIIYPGKVADNNTFRLSNIGELSPQIISIFIDEVKMYLKQSKETVI